VAKRIYSDGRDHVELVVAYIAHSSRKSAHAQEACLRGSGAMVSKVESRQLERSPVLAKSIVLEHANARHQVYYWYKIGRIYTADYLSSSLKMFFGGLFGGGRHGAALVRLLTPVRKGEDQAQVDRRLEDFTAQLLPELERHLP
jgi:EpsI family protein